MCATCMRASQPPIHPHTLGAPIAQDGPYTPGIGGMMPGGGMPGLGSRGSTKTKSVKSGFKRRKRR